MLERIVNGRTDLVFDYVSAGHAATSTDKDGVTLLQWCAYYGDVSAIRFLLAHDASLASLGPYALGAAAFGTEETIQLLLDAGARIDARDMNGDTPLSWASWYTRPDAILRKLLYDGFTIHPARKSMKLSLLGTPGGAVGS